MTALAGIFAPGLPAAPNEERDPAELAAAAMLAPMAPRGAEVGERWRGPGAVLMVARGAWEVAHAGGAAAIAVADDLVVAADAGVYYEAELRGALGGPRGQNEDAVRAPGAAALLLAAYRAWGAACVERVEGDFAFVVWDRRQRRVCCARDYAGSRPLHYAALGDAFVVASTVGGVRGHPRCPNELDLGRLAEQAFDLWGDGRRTAFAAVRAVPPGHAVEWAPGGAPRETRVWRPPAFDGRSRVPAVEAAAELRRVLACAVEERRAPPDEPTAVWLSGGWDSTAVYAAAHEHAAAAGGPVRAVSISYPPGDSGREDETIGAVAASFGGAVHWISIQDVPMLDDLGERAARWDDPFAHPFEAWNDALARGTRASGARVALNGYGGDQLFAVSNAYLADLLAAGRLRRLWREWQATGFRAPQRRAAFWRWAVRPRLGHRAAALGAVVRGGRPLVHYLERPLPPWARPSVARPQGAARDAFAHRRRGQSAAAFEAEWYLTNPYVAALVERVASRALAAGVSLRFPLYDRRVIELASGRPRAERSGAGETKVLLRQAMAGVLPAAVLAPRAGRTGTTTSYWRAAVRARGPELFAAAFERPILADLGVVDPVRLRAAAERVARGDEAHAAALLATLRVELWLRAGATGGRTTDQ